MAVIFAAKAGVTARTNVSSHMTLLTFGVLETFPRHDGTKYHNSQRLIAWTGANDADSGPNGNRVDFDALTSLTGDKDRTLQHTP
jgi:hypothetical protein